MHEEIYEGAWNQLKGEIQRSWGELTDDDMEKAKGDQARLLGLLQEKYGYTIDHARERVAKVMENYDNMTADGEWNEVKGKIQESWGKLTDNDLDQIKGRRTALVGKLQQRYGRSREAAWKEVHEFLGRA